MTSSNINRYSGNEKRLFSSWFNAKQV